MDGRVPSCNWLGLPECSVWTNGGKADCALGGPSCGITVAWPSANTIYLKPSPFGAATAAGRVRARAPAVVLQRVSPTAWARPRSRQALPRSRVGRGHRGPDDARALKPLATVATPTAIEVCYLPSYSPERNPDHYPNGDLTQAVARRAPARDRASPFRTATSRLRSLQRRSERAKKVFHHPRVRDAAQCQLNRAPSNSASSVGACAATSPLDRAPTLNPADGRTKRRVGIRMRFIRA